MGQEAGRQGLRQERVSIAIDCNSSQLVLILDSDWTNHAQICEQFIFIITNKKPLVYYVIIKGEMCEICPEFMFYQQF